MRNGILSAVSPVEAICAAASRRIFIIICAPMTDMIPKVKLAVIEWMSGWMSIHVHISMHACDMIVGDIPSLSATR